MGSVLTVVVPIYNVERYLAECLRSLAGQTYPDLDIVLVDDGSTDGSAEVAQRHVAADPRFRLVRQPNRGLGAARNVGIDFGMGDYLTFVDSDDVLPPYALEVLVGALEQTGSDFASGNVALFTSRGLRQSPLHRGTHRVTRLRSSLATQPNLVYDRLACNKVFRRSFWEQRGLKFPEGVRYEDIPVTVPAYAMAEAVDVIDLPVYYWRQREAGTDQSISQRQGEVRNVVDRFAAVESASRSLAALGETKLKDWYDETALQSDLRMFLDLLPDVDQAYRLRFLDLTGHYLAQVDDRVVDRLAPRLRVAWRLAKERALSELVAVVAASRPGTAPPKVVRRGRGYYVQLPLLDDQHPAAPRRLFLAPEGIRTEVHEVRWADGRLHVRGLAYDVLRGAGNPWGSTRMLWLREAGDRRRFVPLATRTTRIAEAPSSVPYGWAGFSASIDPRRLAGKQGWEPGDWAFNVATLGVDGLRKRALGIGESRPALPASWVADGVRLVPYVQQGRLRLRVERPRNWVTGTRIDGDALVVEGDGLDRAATAVLRLTRVNGVIWRSYPVQLPDEGTSWSARIPLADLVGGSALTDRPVLVGEAGAAWRVAFADGDGEARELPVPTDFAGLRHTVGEVELLARPADDEVLWLRALPPGPMVRAAELTDGVLSLSGELPAGPGAGAGGGRGELRMVLRRREGAGPTELPEPDVILPVEVAGAAWTVRVPLGGEGAPGDGDWLPLYQRDGDAGPIDLPFDVAARRRLPRDVRVGNRRLEVLPDREREVLRLGTVTGRGA
ncbi:glycosyltransferase family 2 protein [Micromonospora sp. NPDC049559]|uniref:glycosyltransferase family 2 protein n=1 Tax=Micromonospora sp. NPDC049559 TaxID=3155923 RepID=UPI00341762F6